MNRETIEKAADKYSYEQWKVEDDFYCRDCMGIIAPPAFVAGAEWRINSVWHDARKEQPSLWKLILRKDRAGDYELGYKAKDDTVSWAYVSDLLPDRKEEEQ